MKTCTVFARTSQTDEALTRKICVARGEDVSRLKNDESRYFAQKDIGSSSLEQIGDEL